MAQYNDLFGFDRFAQAQNIARGWDREREQDAMRREQYAMQQEGQRQQNALAQLQMQREGDTQNALRYGMQNAADLESSQPQDYNANLAFIRNDMMNQYPGADVAKVGAWGKEREAPKQGRVQTGNFRDGIYAINPDQTRGKRLGDAPAGKGLVNINTGNRPMPTAALKMQQEELDAIALASTIKADLGGIRKLVSGGALDLGPVKNIVGKAQNYTGASTENSRNLASFQATLEKMRNDSLRLNKGVQTEGDAQRAWNELLSNINDKNLVMKRLGEIERINNRAAAYRKQNVQNIRENFNNPMIDISAYENQQSVFGDGDNDFSVMSDDDILQALGR